jgi:hypothetical protein
VIRALGAERERTGLRMVSPDAWLITTPLAHIIMFAQKRGKPLFEGPDIKTMREGRLRIVAEWKNTVTEPLT